MAGRLVAGVMVLAALVVGVLVWMDGPDGGADGAPGTAPVVAAPDGQDAAGPVLVAPPTDTDRTRLAAEPAPSPAATDASASAGADDAPPRPRVTLVGRLVTPQGRPVPGARVSLLSGPAAALQLFARVEAAREQDRDGPSPDTDLGEGASDSDDEGRFRVVAKRPETSADEDAGPAFLEAFTGAGPRLLVRHPGFRTVEHDLPPLHEDTVDVGTLVLDPAAALAGRVLGADRSPVAGARVALQRGEQTAEGLGALFGALMGSADEALSLQHTGADGRFLLTGLPPGAAAVVVASDDHPLLATGETVLEAGRTTDLGDLHLAAGTSLAGVVLDEGGRPLADVGVRAAPAGGAGPAVSGQLILGALDRRTTSGADGSFLLTGLADAAHDVVAGGGAFDEARVDAAAPGRRDLTLVVRRRGELLLTLRSGADVALLDGVDVQAWRGDTRAELLDVVAGPALAELVAAGDDPFTGAALPANVSGAALVRAVGSDGAELHLRAPGHGLTVVTAPGPAAGERLALEVVLEPQAVVTGVVLDDLGQPVAGAEVRAEQSGEEASLRGERAWRRTLVVRDEQGREVRRSTNAVEVEARCDEAGRFELAGLCAGGWSLSAEAPGLLDGEALDVELAEGERREGLELVLAAGGTVAGTVREADGAPAGGVRVRLAPVEAQAAAATPEEQVAEQVGRQLMGTLGLPGDGGRQVRTDGEGRFRASGLRPGPWRVSLEENAAQAVQLDLGALLGGGPSREPEQPGERVQVVARQTVEVDLERAPRAGLEVLVLADGRPAAGARVSVREAAESSGGLLSIDLGLGGVVRRTDDRGLLVLDDLQPGRHEVRAALDGAPTLRSETVELLAGERPRVTLAFVGATLRGQVLDGSRGGPAAGVVVRVVRQEPEPVDDEDDDGGGGGLFGGLFSGGSTSFSISTEVNGVRTESAGPGLGGFGGLAADRVVTDGEGRFELAWIEPGTWVVEAGDGPWLPGRSGPVDVSTDETPEPLTLTLRRGGRLGGQAVQGSTEEPLDDVRVELRPQDAGEHRDSATVRAGRFAFEGIPPGRYALVIGSDPERCRREVTVREDGEQTVLLVTLD